MDLVETLGARIGARTTGSAEASAAADAIADAFRECGLEARFQEFRFLGYEPEEPELEIGGERWAAGPCVYAHPTEGTVEGRLRHIGTHVAVKGLFEAPTFAIEDAGGAELARLYANPLGGGAVPFVSGYGHIICGPAAFVSTADGERLRELEGATARLRVGGRFVPGMRDRNVLAEVPGESEETIVVSAHFDSVWRGPGAVDNATGVEGIRRLAERLAGERRRRTLLFCAFAAEEIGLVGARYFVTEARTRGEFARICGIVNLDCIGHGEKLWLKTGPEALKRRALREARRLGLHERYGIHVGPPGPGTDEAPFWDERVPSATILFWPYPEYHLPAEHPSLVDPQRMADAVDLAEAIVQSQIARPLAD